MTGLGEWQGGLPPELRKWIEEYLTERINDGSLSANDMVQLAVEYGLMRPDEFVAEIEGRRALQRHSRFEEAIHEPARNITALAVPHSRAPQAADVAGDDGESGGLLANGRELRAPASPVPASFLRVVDAGIELGVWTADELREGAEHVLAAVFATAGGGSTVADDLEASADEWVQRLRTAGVDEEDLEEAVCASASRVAMAAGLTMTSQVRSRIENGDLAVLETLVEGP